MMNTFDKLVPLLTNLGSDRWSPTAGPSDTVSPNPIARVPDSAPQGPVVAPQSQDVAPRPSSASSEPRASSSGLQQRRQDKFASPRGQPNEGDKSRGSRHASPSLQHRLRRQLDDVHRQLDNAKEIVDLFHAQIQVPPDQARYDLEILQDRYAQLSITLKESLASTSFHSHGPSPTSHGIASLGVDPLAPLRGSPGLDRPRSPIASVAVQTNATSSESRIATPLHTEGDPVPGSRILPENWTSPASPRRLTIRHHEIVFLRICHSRDDPPPGGHRRLGGPSRLLRGASPHGGPLRLLRGASPHGGPLRLLRGASPHGGPLRLLRGASPHGGPLRLLRGASPHGGPPRLFRDVLLRGGPRLLLRGASPPRGHLLLSVWQAIQAQDLALPGDPFLRILVLRNAPPGKPSLQREVPLHLKDNVMRRETQSPLHLSTHHEPLRESPHRRDPIHGLLLLARLLLRGKRRRLMKSPFQLRSRPWWIS